MAFDLTSFFLPELTAWMLTSSSFTPYSIASGNSPAKSHRIPHKSDFFGGSIGVPTTLFFLDWSAAFMQPQEFHWRPSPRGRRRF